MHAYYVFAIYSMFLYLLSMWYYCHVSIISIANHLASVQTILLSTVLPTPATL